jgi:hydrogenase-4 component F
MDLLYILIITTLVSGASLIPVGRKFAPAVTCLGSLAAFVLSVHAASKTLNGGEVVATKDWLSCDSFGALILLLVAFVGLAAAVFSWGYMPKIVGPEDDRKMRRYYALYNLFLLSMLAVPILSQVALVWIAVELTTLLSVFLVSFEQTPEALEAAWKYVVLTCMGAALALFGILILYWGMSVATNDPFTWAGLISSSPKISPTLLNTAFLFILIGFGTKVGLVPLHTWLPDAHSQAPSPICALLSGVETTTVLYAIMRLLPMFQDIYLSYTSMWFVIFGLISVGVAAFLLVQAKDYKRLFAFSTVEHMGIILVAAGLGGYAAHFGATLQIVSHTITKSFCFFAAGATLFATGNREIASVHGLIRISPSAGVFLTIGGLGIAGAPPFAVFLSEFSILRAGIVNGQYIVTGLLALFIVIAFFGIMFQINRMVFGKPSTVSLKVTLPVTCIITLILMAIPVILFGFYIPESLYKLLHLAASFLGK